MEHNVAYIGMYFSILEAIHILITQVIGANVDYFSIFNYYLFSR